jgi:hypothetical protein
MLPHVRTLSELVQAVSQGRDPFVDAFSGAHRAATSSWSAKPAPTEAQARAGNYPLGTVYWNGLTLRIENPAHTIREGEGEDGRPWRNLLMSHYGYVAGTKGADGDGVDVFLGPFPESRKVWVLNQTDAAGAFDEHKLLLGFPDEQAAVDAYRFSYSPGWDRFKPPIRLSLDQLRWWLRWADTTRELTLDLLPSEPEDMNATATPDMTRVFWDSAAMPLSAQTLADVLYGIRRHDASEGLLLDPMTMAELLDGAEVLRLDALVTMAGRLQPRMQALLRVMEVAATGVAPVAMQISDPVKRYGGVHVAVLFELSDGQTITAWFHNPDSSPAKLTPADTLVSWKWLLNKKDITIVVAPESGQDLNLREVARRLMRLAAKNSAAFARANAKRAETMAQVQALKGRLTERQGVLAGLQRRIEEARVAGEAPAVAGGGSLEALVDVQTEAEAAPEPDAAAVSVPNASPGALSLLAIAEQVVGPNAYRTVLAVNDHSTLLGLTVAWDALEALPAEVVALDSVDVADRLDRAEGGQVEVNAFEPGDKVIDLDSGVDLVVARQVGYKVFCQGAKTPWLHANRLKHASGKKAVRTMLDDASGAYIDQDRKAISATASLLRWLREFIRSDKELARNPMDGMFGFSLPMGGSVMNKEQAQKFLTKLVDMAVSRKGGEADLTSAQRERLMDFSHDARVIQEYFEKRMHRGDGNRNQLRTPEMKKQYPEIDNPGKFDSYAVRRPIGRASLDSALFPEEGEAGYVVGQVKAGPHDLVKVYVRGDGRAAVVPDVDGDSLAERATEAGWSDDWRDLLSEAQDVATEKWSDFDLAAVGADKRAQAVEMLLQDLMASAAKLSEFTEATNLEAISDVGQLEGAAQRLFALTAETRAVFKTAMNRAERLGFDLRNDPDTVLGAENKLAALALALNKGDALREQLVIKAKRLRQQAAVAELAAMPPDASLSQRVAAHFRKAGIDGTGDWLVAAIEGKDVDKLRSVLGNLDNRASRAAFSDVTEVKLGATKAMTLAQIDKWAGITPEQRQELDAQQNAARAANSRLESLRDAWAALATINVRADGRSASLQDVIVKEAAAGSTEIRAISRGAASQYGIGRPGAPVKVVKLKPFNAFLKAALGFGDLRKALLALGVAVPDAGAAESSPPSQGASDPSGPPPSLRARGADALTAIAAFMPYSQRRTIASLMKGEEGDFFANKMIEMRGVVEQMPVTYEQDGKGDQATAYLHYFRGGADWYITEKDKNGGVRQAFGLADLYGDGGELGYISISELTQAEVELDLHFTPKTLAAIRGSSAPEPEMQAPAGQTVTAERIGGDLKNHGGFALIVNGERREFVGADPEDMTDRASDLAAARGIPMNEAIAELAVKEGWDKREPMPGPAPVASREAATGTPSAEQEPAPTQPEPAPEPASPEPAPPPAVASLADSKASALAELGLIAAGTHPEMLNPELADTLLRILTDHEMDADVQALGEQALAAFERGALAATS